MIKARDLPEEDVMQTTRVARQIYETEVKNLPVIERLWLVKWMI